MEIHLEDWVLREYISQGKKIGVSGVGKTKLLETIYRKYKKKYDMKLMKQDIIMYPSLTVLETLSFYCPHLTEEEILDHLIKLQLDGLKDVRIGDLKITGGEKKRIFLTYILLDPSPIIICDEPFSGLDDFNTELFFQFISTTNKTIIFSFHNNLRTGRLDELWEIKENKIQKFCSDLTTISLEEIEQSENINRPTKNFIKREFIMIKREPLNYFSKFITLIITICIQNLMIGSVYDYYSKWKKSSIDFYFHELILVYLLNLFYCSVLPISGCANQQNKHYIINHEIQQGIYNQNIYAICVLTIETFFYLISCIIIGFISCRTSDLLGIYIFNIFIVSMFSNYLMWFLTFRFPKLPMMILFIYVSFSFVINFGFLIYFKTKISNFLQYLSIIHQQSNIFLESIEQKNIVIHSLKLLNLDHRHNLLFWIILSTISLSIFPSLLFIF